MSNNGDSHFDCTCGTWIWLDFRGKNALQALAHWRIGANHGGLLVGRRLGAVYLGLAAILFLGRSSAPSDLRTALCVGLLVVMTMLAILGVKEFIACRASSVILVSSAVEFLLELGFANVLLAP